MLPNLLIVGAQKSGTTSLHRLLESHPQIYLPARPQEIHFFDLEENFARGMDWYQNFFGGWDGEPYCGQTSPLYMYEPGVAGRISEALPEARMIFILRNPITRAYSHYWHEVRYGWEELSFAEALRREPERLIGGFEARRHFSYVDRGCYGAQIERFLELFDRRQLLFLKQEELRATPGELRRKLGQFLDLSAEGFRPADGPQGHYNRTRLPRSRRLQRLRRLCARRLRKVAHLIDRINLKAAGYPPLPDAQRAWLHRRFEGEIRTLGDLTGLSVDDWLGLPRGQSSA